MKRNLKIKKQYGIVHKEVLIDKNISAKAKGLYVYLCARSGNKGVCHPTIKTICKDLSITEETFQKYKKELLENKIISIKKIGQTKKHNEYTILKKSNKGYGYVYLDILKDPNISLKSKAIYGFLSSLAGIKFIAFPLAKMIYSFLNISRNTYFKSIKSLKDRNYIKTRQLHINGRFNYCNYYINGKEPEEETSRYIIKQDTTKTTTKKLIKRKSISKVNYDISDYEKKETVVKNNIEYETLFGLYGEKTESKYILENILSVLVSTIYYDTRDLVVKNEQIKINIINGRLKAIFGKLRFNNIKQVVENILKEIKTGTKIKDIRAYVKVALYNNYFQSEQSNYNSLRGF